MGAGIQRQEPQLNYSTIVMIRQSDLQRRRVQNIPILNRLSDSLMIQIKTKILQNKDLKRMADFIEQNCRPFTLSQTGSYRGQIQSSLKHGIGEEIVDNEQYYYLGEWKEDFMEGYGCLIYKNGEYYVISCLLLKEGNFLRNETSGYGIYYLQDGSYFKGKWLNNLQNGIGEEVLSSGDIYTGSFVDGYKEGKGKQVWQNGDSFEGEFKNDELFKGTMQYFQFGSYNGEFQNGLPNGEGRMIRDNGHYYQGSELIYVGSYKQGKRHGYGQLKDENGIIKGIWENDQLIRQDLN